MYCRFIADVLFNTEEGITMTFHKYLIFMFFVVSLISVSCASHTAVYPDPVNIKSVIKPGDTVIVMTRDNQETEFVVSEVTDEAIIGENHKILFADIEKLQEQTVSAGENFGIITLMTIGAAAEGMSGAASGMTFK